MKIRTKYRPPCGCVIEYTIEDNSITGAELLGLCPQHQREMDEYQARLLHRDG